MSQRSKRELSDEIRPRYLKAKKSEKKTMLDEFVAATCYHRKYATRILKHGRPRHSGKKHGLPKVYQGEVVVVLEQIWEVCGRNWQDSTIIIAPFLANRACVRAAEPLSGN